MDDLTIGENQSDETKIGDIVWQSELVLGQLKLRAAEAVETAVTVVGKVQDGLLASDAGVLHAIVGPAGVRSADALASDVIQNRRVLRRACLPPAVILGNGNGSNMGGLAAIALQPSLRAVGKPQERQIPITAPMH
jgi:hypothetical protein